MKKIEMQTFKCMYFLQGTLHYIIEIKVNPAATSQAESDRSLWLKVDRKNLTIEQLGFRSRDSAGEIQERFFEQGYLKFNNTFGTFIKKYNTGQYSLENLSGCGIPEDLALAIQSFLQETTSHVKD